MKLNDIRSIGVLNAHDGSFNLSACFHHGSGHATFVNVTKEAKEACDQDKKKLKQLFIATYEKSGPINL